MNKSIVFLLLLFSSMVFSCSCGSGTEDSHSFVTTMGLDSVQRFYKNYFKLDDSKKRPRNFVVRGIRIDTSNLRTYLNVFNEWAEKGGILEHIRDSILRIDSATYTHYFWAVGQIPGISVDTTPRGVISDKLYFMVIPVLQDTTKDRHNWINPLDYDSTGYEHSAAASYYYKMIARNIGGKDGETKSSKDSVSFYDYGQKDP